MSKNPIFNASGCKDLTAHKAINNASRSERKETGNSKPAKVYICSPFAGDTEANVEKALKYCRFAIDKGKLPIAPHCYFPRFMDDSNPAERELGMDFAIRLLYGCRELWVFGDKISEGMKREIAAAQWRNIRIRRFGENLEEM